MGERQRRAVEEHHAVLDGARVAVVGGGVQLQRGDELRYPLGLHDKGVGGDVGVARAQLHEVLVVHAVAHLLQPRGHCAFAGAGCTLEEYKHEKEG